MVVLIYIVFCRWGSHRFSLLMSVDWAIFFGLLYCNNWGVTLGVRCLPINGLLECTGGSQARSSRRIRRLIGDVHRFNFAGPILVSRGGRLVTKRKQLTTTRVLRVSGIPTVQLDGLSRGRGGTCEVTSGGLTLGTN